jgi:nitronate monooxygenase
MLGASGVLLGTRFYASLEADGAEEAKKRICAATSGSTVRSIIFDTRATMSGRRRLPGAA